MPLTVKKLAGQTAFGSFACLSICPTFSCDVLITIWARALKLAEHIGAEN